MRVLLRRKGDATRGKAMQMADNNVPEIETEKLSPE